MTDNEKLKKKIRKVIEEMITVYEDEFTDKFGELEIKDSIKHKTQISTLGIEDDQLIELIKADVEDLLGTYLLQKSFKKRKIINK